MPHDKAPAVGINLSALRTRLRAFAKSIPGRFQSINEWIAEKTNSSVERVVQVELVSLLGIGWTMIQIEEFSLAILAFIVFAVIAMTQLVIWPGIRGSKEITVVLKCFSTVILLLISAFFIVVTIERREDRPWSNIQKLWIKKAPATASAPIVDIGPEPTLESLFNTEMGYWRFTVTTNEKYYDKREGKIHVIPIKRQIYAEPDAKVDFVGFLVQQNSEFADGDLTFVICSWLVGQVAPTLEFRKHTMPTVWFNPSQAGQRTDFNDLTFSGRVFIYYDGLMSAKQISTLQDIYSKKGMTVDLRGPEYVAAQVLAWENKKALQKAKK
ncbi:MAG TPA: hypothetical protein VMU45_14595 [Candidatus Eisenbacteria bacterium]|nr:hypothetical protein [Candidatus Eisenbacteria bacterium]